MGHTPLWAFMYEPQLPDDIQPAREILEKYSGISPRDVDSHLHAVRDKAWKVVRYPCIGRWRFLYLTPADDARFQEVLTRLTDARSGDVLLDLGCCMGQSLRQFAFHGVEPKRLYGSDLQHEFVELGYELFNDRERMKGRFVTGDMLDPGDKSLRALDGKVTIVHAQSFWHLFDRPDQLALARRHVRFLKPGTKRALIYGRHIGSVRPGEMQTSRRTWFLHDQASFQTLWDEVGVATKTRWRVELEHTGELPIQIPGLGSDARTSRYAVYQLA